MEELKNDVIHKPKHYCFSKFEPKDVIREWGLNFNLGSAVKYIARAGRKDDIIQDLKKAREFLTFEIEALEAERKEKEPPQDHVNCNCDIWGKLRKAAGYNEKEPDGVRLSEVISMSSQEFTDRFRDLQNGEGITDAYHFEFVDDRGRRWVLTQIEQEYHGLKDKILRMDLRLWFTDGVNEMELTLRDRRSCR